MVGAAWSGVEAPATVDAGLEAATHFAGRRMRGPRSADSELRRGMRTGPVLANLDESSGATSVETAAAWGAAELLIWHANVQGLRSSTAELVGRIRMCERRPDILCLNETFLDKTIGEVPIEGYEQIARWDREIGEAAITRGGVVVYAACAISGQVTLIEKSVEAERLWLLIHTERGPFMLGAWY